MQASRMSAAVEAPQFHHNRRHADQPIDSTLGLVRFVDDGNRSVATWVNYGCHPTILGGDNLFWSTDMFNSNLPAAIIWEGGERLIETALKFVWERS